MNKILASIFILYFLSSCYKEEHKVIENLKGIYDCKYSYSEIYNGVETTRTGIGTIEFYDVVAYPRKLRIEIPYQEALCFMPNFESLTFKANSKDYTLQMEGYFYSGDSLFLHYSTGNGSHSGGSSYTYIGRKR